MEQSEIDPNADKIVGDLVTNSLRQIDSALRQELTEKPINEVAPYVEEALAASGVILSAHELQAYAQSVTDNEDFIFNLVG